MDNQTKHNLTRIYKQFVRPLRKYLAYAVICMFIIAFCTAAHAWLMQPVLDEIFINKNIDILPLVAAGVLAIALIKGFASYGERVIMTFVGEKIIRKLQMHLFRHLMYSDISMHSQQSAGHLISRFNNDIGAMRTLVSSLIVNLSKEFITLICLLGVMFYQSWSLTLLVFAVFPISILPIRQIGRRIKKLARQSQEQMADLTSRLNESFFGYREIKSYNKQEHEITTMQSSLDKLFGLVIKSAKVGSLSSPIMEALGGIAVAGVIWYGGYQVIEGTTTAGTFTSFITAFIMAYKPVKSLANLNNILQSGNAATQRFFELIDNNPDVKDIQNAKNLEVKKGNIEFKNVSFAYDDTNKALNNVSFSVPAGKMVALVGHSGSGKSTIMSLLLRFYNKSKGKIMVDGQEVTTVTQQSLRDTMAYVSQDVFLFNDTIKQNILYSNLDATDAKLVNAAKSAQADEFISKMPDGYNSPVGQRGNNLSGGQKQRISIARAFLKDAPILLLDEATSALDPIAERKIQKSIEELSKGRTTLVIAHRLSTVINADIIYVMNKGKITASGTHKELLEKSKLYKDLFGSQAVAN